MTILIDTTTKQLSEVYSNSDSKKKKNKNTVRPLGSPMASSGTRTEQQASPVSFPTGGPTAWGDRESQLFFAGVPSEPNLDSSGYRRLSREDIYTDISVQLGAVSGNSRIQRIGAYISLMPDDSVRYEIKLSCNLTSRASETLRQARADRNEWIEQQVEYYTATYPGAFVGRCRYTPRRGSWSSEYKKNIRSAILAVWPTDEGFGGEFRYGDEIFLLDMTDLSTEQMKYYSCQLEYHGSVGETE